MTNTFNTLNTLTTLVNSHLKNKIHYAGDIPVIADHSDCNKFLVEYMLKLYSETSFFACMHTDSHQCFTMATKLFPISDIADFKYFCKHIEYISSDIVDQLVELVESGKYDGDFISLHRAAEELFTTIALHPIEICGNSTLVRAYLD